MAIAFKQNNVITEIGPGGVLHSLFSTIAYRIENGWGNKFPTIMGDLYDGQLPQEKAKIGLQEIRQIKKALELLPPTDVIWDIEIQMHSPHGERVLTLTSRMQHSFTSQRMAEI